MFFFVALLGCDSGPPPAPPQLGGPPNGAPSGPPNSAPHGAPHGAAAQAARGAPTLASPWEGAWTVTAYAPLAAGTPEDAGAAALAAGLGLQPRAWTGPRPAARPGEAALVWVPAGTDLDTLSRELAPRPGPQGEVVVVLAPGDPAWAAAAAERLPWSSLAVVDPALSLALWVDTAADHAAPPTAADHAAPHLGTPDPALAGRLAAWEIADHYNVAYVPAAGTYPPGLDARLGPYDPAALTAPDPRTRAEAVRAEARHTSPAAPAALTAPDALAGDALANDPSVAVRLAVAETTRSPATRRRLAADPEPLVRARVADTLDDVTLLDPLLDDPSSVVRLVATARLGALARANPAAVAPLLRRALGSPDAYQRWKAAWGLGRVPGSADGLIPLLRDPDIDVRREAARSLGRLGDPAAIPPLLDALQDTNSFVRRWAAAALGELHASDARSALRAAAKDPTTLVAQAAARALSQLGEPAQAPPFSPPGKPTTDAELDRLISSPDATTRKDVSKFLAGREDAGPRLALLARDPDSEVRKSAVEAMGWSAATAAAALDHLGDPDPDVRVTALDAVRRQGVGTAAALAPLLAESDAEIRLRAAEALASLGPSDVLRALIADPDERVRAAVAAVHPDAVPANEPSILVRRAAGAPSATTPSATTPSPSTGPLSGDPTGALPGSPYAAWADGVFSHEDDLLHVRFSWNDAEDRPSAHRTLRPPVLRPYGHPDRG